MWRNADALGLGPGAPLERVGSNPTTGTPQACNPSANGQATHNRSAKGLDPCQARNTPVT